ncbi:unannotated protein [freshwater metagenome]|uniref:Unannotated protein n=1 Tax=freshwater metagenome TaxID=449393 RepID=A0A6J7S8E7_9ZZZZ
MWFAWDLMRIVAFMTTPGRPLLLSRDPDLLEDVHRLAVASGVEPDIAGSAAEGRRLWSSATVVVVGHDIAVEVAAAGLRRRSAVLVATHVDDDTVPWRAALALGAEHVITLPRGGGFLMHKFAEGGEADASRATVVGVVGGAGGAGASVIAASAAVVAARLGLDVILIDADPDGGGVDLLLGAEEAPGARWCDFAGVTSVLAPDTLRAALPSAHGFDVLSVDRDSADPLPQEAVSAVVDSAVSAYDLVVLDLPRGRPEVLENLCSRCDVVLLVVTPDVRGASAAQRRLAGLRALAPIRLVVRHRPGAQIDPDQLATWLDLEVAAEIAHDSRLSAAIDRGDPPAAQERSRLARTCTELVANLAGPR